jgi:WD40 repeat protein
MTAVAFFWSILSPAPRFTVTGDSQLSLLNVSPDGKLFAIEASNEVQLWRVATGEQAAVIPLPNKVIIDAVFTPDSQRLILDYFEKGVQEPGQTARIQPIAADQSEVTVPLASAPSYHYLNGFATPRSFLLSPDGKYMAYLCPKKKNSQEYQLKLWDIAAEKEKIALDSVAYDISRTPMVFSRDGRLLAASVSEEGGAGEDNYSVVRATTSAIVKIWEVSTGRLMHKLTVPPTLPPVIEKSGKPLHVGCSALAFSPNGQAVVGFIAPGFASSDNQVVFWDLANGTPPKILKSRELVGDGYNALLRFASTSQQILVELPSRVMSAAHLCDLAGSQPRVLKTFANIPLLSLDGTCLATTDELSGLGGLFKRLVRPDENNVQERAKVQLMDFGTLEGRDIYHLSWFDRDGSLTPYVFSADNQSLVIAYYYFDTNAKKLINSLRVCDVSSGRYLAKLPGSNAAFTEDGKTLITQENLVENQRKVGGIVRVYAYPFQTPLLAIFGWAMLPTAVAILLAWLWRARRLWTQQTQPA